MQAELLGSKCITKKKIISKLTRTAHTCLFAATSTLEPLALVIFVLFHFLHIKFLIWGGDAGDIKRSELDSRLDKDVNSELGMSSIS